jgi:hypothetical protein
MRRISTAFTAAALALGMTLGLTGQPAQAAVGFDSSYQFESAFLVLKPGENGTFAVFFANTGSTAWVVGTPTQVNLAICAADKVTCNVSSPNAAFGVGWLSTTAYATHTKSAVAPGDFSPFSYNIKVPSLQPLGVYRFNGDLVLGSTGERIHPEGYFQDANVSTPPVALGITPGWSTDEDNEVSATVPGNGQHTYTITTTLTGTLSFAAIESGNIVQNSDGTYSFCDKNQDKKADGIGAGGVLITAVNGSSVPPSTISINQAIPSSGSMTVTIDSSTKNQRVRLIAWQDKSQNSQIDLTTQSTDTTCNTYQPYDVANDGLMTVSGRKFYFPAKGQFGTQFPDGSGNPQCEPVFRHDGTNQVFSAGPTTDTSLRFTYDSNDIFKISGTQVSVDVFKANLTPAPDGISGGSSIKINYDPNASGFSTFDICTTAGFQAPNNVTGATGNFDNGSLAEDVRVSFTAPSANQNQAYNIQRASLGATTTANTTNCNLNATAPNNDSAGTPAGNQFSTVGAVTVQPGQTGTFTNFDLANGGYCVRVTVQNPTLGLNSFSNYVPVNIPGTGDAIAPTSSSATLTSSGGFANTLDAGDKIFIDFSEAMSIAANAVVRVTDSDCGTATQAGPAACSGGNTNTVGDIICGTNASCVVQTGPAGANTELVITMNGNPTFIAAGSTAGSQFPVVVTDSSGITDLSGNAWNLAGSPDKVFGPQGS